MQDVNNHNDENNGSVSSPIRQRQFHMESQPTVMSTSGMHGLPPVYLRVPLADQYAAGVAEPDLDSRRADPSMFSRVNGGIDLGTPESRRAYQSTLREMTLRRRLGL
jgi:hypothetical protein